MELLLQLLVGGIAAGAIYALVALGLAIVWNVTRVLHLAQGAVFAVAAYTAYLLNHTLGLSLLVSFVLTTIVACLLGVGLELALFRPMRDASQAVKLMVAIGLLIFCANLLALAFGNDPKILRLETDLGNLQMGGVSITGVRLLIIGVSVVLFGLTQLFLVKTKMGKAMRAVASNPEMAEVVGIDAKRVNLLAFVVGSALASPAAVLVSLDTGLDPNMGLNIILMVLAAILVGGLGSLPGAIIGALFIGIVQNVGIWQIPSQWQTAIAFGVLFIFIIFKPQGFLGEKA
ncbi:MAG: branched-chain amino acid ABC transporter permease [Chloroflexi bacterium]|nr:branched-chain amino acid ABC transporter permease [Chloroflexota bacterium]